MQSSDPSAAGYSAFADGVAANRASSGDGSAAARPQSDTIKCDICIIGGGSGGLTVAAAAAALGRDVVLIEKHKMGGDCLNYGCVPSKALIAAARRAQLVRTSPAFGIEVQNLQIDHQKVHDHVKGVMAAIEPNDSIERFTGLGVRVITATGRFVDKATVAAGDYRIKARRFVVATGSSPLIPPIPGLSEVPYFTNETIFDHSDRIDHLIIIGGGSVGIELAQAYRRLGSEVTVLEAAKALSKDDPEMSRIVLDRLRGEGIDIREGVQIEEIDSRFRKIRAAVKTGERSEIIEGSHLLVAAGRKPNVAGLGLEAAGIRYTEKGIMVNRGLVTTNGRVHAIGDVVGGHQFTHVANYHAGIVIKKALFHLPVRTKAHIIPWVTFTDPELAHVGLTEEEAVKRHGKINVLRWPYNDNDRAQTERATVGHVKVITDRTGRIRGASIVGGQAGELIQMWSLAISQKMTIRAMADWISPYPTLGELNKRAALVSYWRAPSNPLLRKAIGLLANLG